MKKKLLASLLAISLLPVMTFTNPSVAAPQQTPSNLKDPLFYGTDEKGDYKYVYALATAYNIIEDPNKEWADPPTQTDTKPFNGIDMAFYYKYRLAQSEAVAHSIYSQQFPHLTPTEIANIKKEDITFIPAFARASGDNASNITLSENDVRKLMAESRKTDGTRMALGWQNYDESKITEIKGQSTTTMKFDRVEYGKYSNINSIRYRLNTKIDSIKGFEKISRKQMEDAIKRDVINPLSEAYRQDFVEKKGTSADARYRQAYRTSFSAITDTLKGENEENQQQTQPTPRPGNPWDNPTPTPTPRQNQLSESQKVQAFINWDSNQATKSNFIRQYQKVPKQGDPFSFDRTNREKWNQYIKTVTAYHQNDEDKFFKTYKSIMVEQLKNEGLLPRNNPTLEKYLSSKGYKIYDNPIKNYAFYAVRVKIYIRPDLWAETPKPVPVPPPAGTPPGHKCYVVTNAYKGKDLGLTQSDFTNIFTKVIVQDESGGNTTVIRQPKYIKRSLRIQPFQDEVYTICVPIEDDTPKKVIFKSCINKNYNGTDGNKPPNEETFKNNCKETNLILRSEVVDLIADVDFTIAQIRPGPPRDGTIEYSARGTGSSNIPTNWEGLKTMQEWWDSLGYTTPSGVNKYQKVLYTSDRLWVYPLAPGQSCPTAAQVRATGWNNGFSSDYGHSFHTGLWTDPYQNRTSVSPIGVAGSFAKGNVFEKYIGIEPWGSATPRRIDIQSWKSSYPHATYVTLVAAYEINHHKNEPTKETNWDNNIAIKCKRLPLQNTPGKTPPPDTHDMSKCKSFYISGKSTDPKVPPQLAGIIHEFKVNWEKGPLKIPGNAEIIGYSYKEITGECYKRYQSRWWQKAVDYKTDGSLITAAFYPIEVNGTPDSNGKKTYKVLNTGQPTKTSVPIVMSHGGEECDCYTYTGSDGKSHRSCRSSKDWAEVLDTVTVRYHLGAYQDKYNALEDPTTNQPIIKSGYPFRITSNQYGHGLWAAGVWQGNTDNNSWQGNVKLFDPTYYIEYPARSENKVTSWKGDLRPNSSKRVFKAADLEYANPYNKDAFSTWNKAAQSYNLFQLMNAYNFATGPRDVKPANPGRVIYSSIDFGSNASDEYLYVENWYASKVQVYNPWTSTYNDANGQWSEVVDCDRSRISVDADTAWADAYVHPSDPERGLDSQNNQDTRRKDEYTKGRFEKRNN